MDNSKIQPIIDWPQPMSIKSLRGFLGLTSYYRKLVFHYGLIAKLLTNMLQQENFSWNTDSIVAFDKLKQALASTPILDLLDFTKQFVVETYASSIGISVFLCQDGHPITYLSKALSRCNLDLSTLDKEMLAIVFTVQNWRPYLHGQQFRIVTNHKPIKYFLE